MRNILAVKLRALKQDLEVWNREVSGNVSTKKLAASSQLGLWDSKERERPLFVEEREARRVVPEDFKIWTVLEEI